MSVNFVIDVLTSMSTEDLKFAELMFIEVILTGCGYRVFHGEYDEGLVFDVIVEYGSHMSSYEFTLDYELPLYWDDFAVSVTNAGFIREANGQMILRIGVDDLYSGRNINDVWRALLIAGNSSDYSLVDALNQVLTALIEEFN